MMALLNWLLGHQKTIGAILGGISFLHDELERFIPAKQAAHDVLVAKMVNSADEIQQATAVLAGVKGLLGKVSA